MAGTTPKGLPYPQNADAPNVAVDMQSLATSVDALFDDYADTSSAQTFSNKTLANPRVDTAVNLNAGAVVIFEGATGDAYQTTLTVVDPTADRTVTLPNATDTLVGKATTDTLTNKTLEAPVINNATFTGQQSGLQIAFNDSIVFEGTTADSNELTLSAGEPTADRVVTLPDETGTLATIAKAIDDARMTSLMLGGM